jgi:hypothetical protein
MFIIIISEFSFLLKTFIKFKYYFLSVFFFYEKNKKYILIIKCVQSLCFTVVRATI